MKQFEIHLGDWQRILFGQAPPIFLLEVLIRTILVYLFLLLALRWLGKRMSGQLSILEMAVMLTLGAIVSVGMQVPDRGITLSMFVLICTIIFHRGISALGVKSARVEEITQGRISTLLKDGVLDLEEMRRCRISRQQLLAELRGSGILNLGEVRRVYLEASGLFSILKARTVMPGLTTLPSGDNKIASALRHTNYMVCVVCGKLNNNQPLINKCPVCGSSQWTPAVSLSTKTS